MLPQELRLRRHEVQELFKKGVEVFTPFFVLRELPMKPTEEAGEPRPARYAVVLPKKMYKTLVERNRLRRLVYHYLKEQSLTNPEYEKTVVVMPRARFFQETS